WTSPPCPYTPLFRSDAPEVVVAEGFDRAEATGDAGVVHQHGDVADRLGSIEDGGGCGRVGDVDPQRAQGMVVAMQCRLEACGVLVGARMDHQHGEAVAVQPPGDRAADAAGAAADDG